MGLDNVVTQHRLCNCCGDPRCPETNEPCLCAYGTCEARCHVHRFDNSIPTYGCDCLELGVLEYLPDLSDEELTCIKDAEWFDDAKGALLAPICQLPYDYRQYILWPLTIALPLTRVDQPLKRYNEVDGFYHA